MAATRNFDNELQTIPDEGPTFTLGKEEFHCLPMPPAEVMARVGAANINVAEWIEDVLVREVLASHPVGADDGVATVWEPTDDIDRWRALMADPKRPIPVQNVADIVMWLYKEYAGNRPTPRSAR